MTSDDIDNDDIGWHFQWWHRITLSMMTSDYIINDDIGWHCERCQVLEKVCPLRRKLRRRRQSGQICLLVACGKEDPSWLSFCPTQIWTIVLPYSLSLTCTGVVQTLNDVTLAIEDTIFEYEAKMKKNIRNGTVENIYYYERESRKSMPRYMVVYANKFKV